MHTMHIGIDIRHLCTPHPTGVGHYSYEIITQLLTHTDIHWTLFASGGKSTLRHLPTPLITSRPHITVHPYRTSNRILNTKLRTKQVYLEDLVASPIDGWFFPNLDFIRTRKPYVITAHDVSFAFLPEYFSPKTRLWHRLVEPRRLYQEANHIISVSQSTTTDLEQVFQIPSQKIDTIRLTATPEFSPHILPNDRHTLLTYGIKTPYLLSLSTLEPRKNHLGLLQAYEQWVHKTKNPIPWIIVGNRGYRSKDILHAIKKSSARHYITYLGYIDTKHRPVFTRHAKALLFPSFYEGYGLPVQEALQSGTPVLTSSNSALLEHVSPQILHVNPWHIQEMSAGIDAILSLPVTKGIETPMTWRDITLHTREILEKYLS